MGLGCSHLQHQLPRGLLLRWCVVSSTGAGAGVGVGVGVGGVGVGVQVEEYNPFVADGLPLPQHDACVRDQTPCEDALAI